MEMTMIIEKIRNKEFIVKDMLIKHPKTRDNDSLLLAYVWVYQAGGKDHINGISMKDFILDFIDKKFAEPSGITRCRRKLQESHPELRGELYEKRHQMAKSIKEEIKEWTDTLL